MCLEVDEAVWTRAEVEVEFKGTVEGVEEDDFVLVVTQVPECVKKFFLLVVGDEGVGEKYD